MCTRRTASPRVKEPPRAPEAAGFTLIEVLTALLIGAVVVGAVVALLSAQARISRLETGREEARHNARAALEQIVAELRAVGPDGIVAAGTNTITFRSPRAWGLVCRHTPERLAVIFPSAAGPALRTGEEWAALPPVGASTTWQFLEVNDLSGSAAERMSARAACAALEPGDLERSAVRAYGPRATGATLGIPPGGAGLDAGTPFYLFDDVRYQVAPAAGVEIYWIRRNTGPAMVMTPLAGPVPQHGGLTFRYLDASGAPVVDLSTAAARARIRRVEVVVVAQNRAVGGVPQRDSVASVVHLRNRP
jgi:prepilin-type N-terminal cleavage/methylation domain-containing protein